MSFISKVLRMISSMGTSGTVGCNIFWIDEPEMPKSLIEKK